MIIFKVRYARLRCAATPHRPLLPRRCRVLLLWRPDYTQPRFADTARRTSSPTTRSSPTRTTLRRSTALPTRPTARRSPLEESRSVRISAPRNQLRARWTDRVIDTGANASAEEQEEGADDGTEQVIDVVYSFRLNQTGFDKKGYLTYLKGTCKSLGRPRHGTNVWQAT
jgi:hypothetical protein